ncbi:ABC transporter ATP-binding protein [uncultured Dubosiella sp.]|uniref:ABC transporter ATP-binding protein n=2 Tax=uncultured Dubosiella sp. TaxID=1937011 RepID=UPI00208B64C6|nr:ABC transporter ATP-binding protein [uncultured Dubosiella sp.]GJM58277.1 ABC transporter [Erysipelotrichaceae bacterium OPF54]
MPHKRRTHEKPENMKKTMRQLLSYMAAYKWGFVIGIVCAVASVSIAVIGPKITGEIITEIANGFMNKVQGIGGIDFDAIKKTCAILLAIYAFSAGMEYAQSFIMATVSNKIGYRLRAQMSEKIDRLPFSYFDSHSRGDVISRFTNDVDTMVQSLNQSLASLVSNIVRIVGYLWMMLSISWQMTLLALLIIPLSLAVVIVITKNSQRFFLAQQNSLGLLNGHIEEMYGAHEIVTAFNGQKKSIEKFEMYNGQLYDSAWRSQFLSGLMQPMTMMIGNLGYVGVSILGGYLVLHQVIAIGDIQSFITYTRSFTQPINQIAQSMNMLQSTMAAAERVFAFLNEPEVLPDTKNPVPVAFEGKPLIQGQVVFENVRFGYKPDKIVINDFSMFVRPGQKIAIVGPTGAGKTTLVKLLMRFYELNGGAIYIDGHDTRTFKRKDLRSLVGMVLQDAWLFEGTVRDNLKFGDPDASDEKMKRAAKMAHVDHFIETLDNGYDTMLSEGSANVSQGQRQLLTIARAFLSDPKILILDEATSSVDTRTEVLIQKGMDALMEGRTSFVIAHRLSTIRNADAILVLNEGDIVEIGDHESLMRRNGFYTKLYNAQFSSEEE